MNSPTRDTPYVRLAPIHLASIGGIIGPVGFVGAWMVGSFTTTGYSLINDAISRLAATGSTTRPLMTAGFLAFGAGVPAFGYALRNELGGYAGITAIVSGVATLSVAALPLDVSPRVDVAHGVAASLGYAAITLTPLLASTPLAKLGWRRASTVSKVCSVVSAASLVATLPGPAHGLFQRIGLSVGDMWIVAAATTMLFTHSKND